MERSIARKFVLARKEVEEALWDWFKKKDVPMPNNANQLSITMQEQFVDDVEVSWDTKDTFTP